MPPFRRPQAPAPTIRRLQVLGLVLALLMSLPYWAEVSSALGASRGARAVAGEGKYPVDRQGRVLAEVREGKSVRWVVNLPDLAAGRGGESRFTVKDTIDERLAYRPGSLRTPPGVTSQLAADKLLLTGRYPDGVEGRATVAAAPFEGGRARVELSPADFYADGLPTASHVRGWGVVRVDGAATGVRTKVTVRDAAGRPVAGFAQRVLSGGVLDLSGLGYPVHRAAGTSYDTSKVTVTAKGGEGGAGARMVVAFSGDAPQVSYRTRVLRTGAESGEVQGRADAVVDGRRWALAAAPVRVVVAVGKRPVRRTEGARGPVASKSPAGASGSPRAPRPARSLNTPGPPSAGGAEGSRSRRATESCTPDTGFTHCVRYTSSGADQTFAVPAGVSRLDVRMWGAGGGHVSTSVRTRGGGSAGFTKGTVAVTPGESLKVTAGAGGTISSGSRSYGGGGLAGTGANFAGGGGGMSALWRTTAPLLIAGGGGGGPGSTGGTGDTTNAGGGGGGDTGTYVSNTDGRQAWWGKQDDGGATGSTANCVTAPKAGTKFQGGDGGGNPVVVGQPNGGGGGGGGYWGGGGGGCAANNTSSGGGGGGGSGYVGGTGVSDATTTAGASATAASTDTAPAGASDGQYVSGVGVGRGANTSHVGGAGMVVIQYRVKVGLSITKTPATGTYTPGSPLTYTITAANSGPAPAVSARITDRLPDALKAFTWSCAAAEGSSCGSTTTGSAVIDRQVDIGVGGKVTYTVTGTVPADTTGRLTNSAFVTRPADSVDDNCDASCRSDSALTAEPKAGLEITKVLLTSPVVPGQKVEWRVSVKNNGPSKARDVVVKDAVPAGVTATTMDGASVCALADGRYACPAVDIDRGATKSWTLEGRLDAAATGAPENTATVTGGPDPSASERTAVASPSSASPQANLQISKVLQTSPVVPGQAISWRVTVFNAGPSLARDVVLKDRVPAGVTGATMDGASDCVLAAGEFTCPAVQVEPGRNRSWTLRGTLDPDATTTPTNTVRLTGGPDPSATERTAVASPTASPEPRAHLEVTKVLLTSPVVPGEKIEWRVTVKNAGPSRARNVVVRDAVPAGVDSPSMTGDSVCTLAEGTYACAAVEIAAGATKSWTLSGTLDADATVTPSNSVTVTGGPDPSTGTHTAVASPSGSPEARARLEVTKVLLTSPVVPGEKIEWRVTVKNAGPSRARDVQVSDTVPSGVAKASMTADSDGADCPVTGGVAKCAATELAVGAAKAYTLSATLDAGATTTPTNTATVTGGPDPSAATRTAVASPSGSPEARARLSISKVLLTSPVVPGEKIQWRVTVRNNGPSLARDVVVRDEIPDQVVGAKLTDDANGTACPVTSGTAVCPAVQLAVGASRSYTLEGTLAQDADGVPENTATVTGGPDPDGATRTAVASPSGSVAPRADVTVTKTLVTSPVVPGADIEWRVTVTNNGPSRAKNLVVRDRIPTDVDEPRFRGPADEACPVTDGEAVCAPFDLAVGASRSFTLDGTLDPDATSAPRNTARVTGGPGPSATERTAVASATSAAPRASLVVTKVLVTSPVVPGGEITWRVTVKNNGPSRARNVVVEDTVPAGVDSPAMTGDSTCTLTEGTYACAAVEIAAGASKTWALSGTLDPDATTTPNNSVRVTGGPDPSASTRTAVASPTASPQARARLEVTKTLVTSPVVPGEKIEWRVTVKNNGPSRARDVVVRDRVPSGVKKVSMSGSSSCALAAGEYTCDAVEIAKGASKTWTLSGTLDPDATAAPVNTVTVTGGPDPGTPTHAVTATPTASPSHRTSLVVSKVLVTSPVLPGRPVQWRVTVTNNGPSDAGLVNVVERVPAGVTDHSMRGDGACAPGKEDDSYLCSVDALAAGASATWTLTGTLDADAEAAPANTVTVIEGPVPSHTDDTTGKKATASPVAAQRVELSKRVDRTAVGAGGTVTYTITAANTGGNDADGVTVQDDLEGVVDEAAYNDDAKATVDGEATANRPSYAAPLLTWTGDIPRGKSVEIVYTVTLPETLRTGTDRRLVNEVSSETPGSTCRKAVAAAACTTSTGVSDTTLKKSVSPGRPQAGEKVTYTVEVRNAGRADSKGYTFTDDLADVLDDARWNGDAAADTGPEPVFDAGAKKLTWTGDVPAGEVVTITYSVTVGSPPGGDQRLTNRVTSPKPGSNCPPWPARSGPECATGTTGDDGVVRRLRIAHTVDKAVARPGEKVTYTVRITNPGSAPYERPAATVGLDEVLDDATYNGDAAADVGEVRVTGAPSGRALLAARADRADVRWSAARLAPGEQAVVTYSVTVRKPPSGDATMTSYAFTPGQPSNCPVDDDSRRECLARTTIKGDAAAALTYAKSYQGPHEPRPGDVVTYTVTVANRGEGDAKGAGFTDDLSRVIDDAAYRRDARATGGSVSYAAPVLRWRGDVAAGRAVSVTYSFEVRKAERLGDRTLTNRIVSTGPGGNCRAGSGDPDCGVTGIVVRPGPVLPPTGSRALLYGGAAALVVLSGLALMLMVRTRRRGRA
ncbi:DUF7927 domain-containing protein [Streptomyces formicae]